MRHHVQVASPLQPFPPPVTVLHSVRISSVEVEARDRRRRIDVQFPGHPVQVGQLQVDATHGQHAGFEQVDVAVIVTGNLTETWREVAVISSSQTSHHEDVETKEEEEGKSMYFAIHCDGRLILLGLPLSKERQVVVVLHL